MGTEPFELGTEAVVTVFRLAPEAAGLLWCDLQLIDVRAAMAVGEDPVANKQTQKQRLQLLKGSKFTLLIQLVKWEKISF